MVTSTLRGYSRWLAYPLMSVAAGCLPGGMLDVHARVGTFAFTFIGASLGGAVAAGVSLSSRWWLGPLIAPALGSAALLVERYVLYVSGWTWEQVFTGILSEMNQPGLVGTAFLLTAPLVGLHAYRLRRADPWPLGWLIYSVGPALLWLIAVFIKTATGQWIHLGFVILLSLGSRFALEVALKLSKP